MHVDHDVRDGLPRGVLESLAVLAGITLIVLHSAGVVSDGITGGTILLGSGGLSLTARGIPSRRQDEQ